MKRLTNFFKTNLTHKILPCLGVFLFIFNILLVGNVSAYKYNYPATELNSDVKEHIKSLQKYNDYNYCLAHVDMSVTSMGHLIHVYLFNRNDITFHCSTSGGWDAVRSSGSLEYYYYLLRADNKYVILDEGVKNGEIKNIITGGYGVGSGYSVWGNVNVYGNSLDDIWYKADTFVAPSFGETEESINNLVGGYCLVHPGDLPYDHTFEFKVTRRYADDHSKDATVFTAELDYSSKYYKSINDSSGVLSEFWFEIPYSDIYNFEKGQEFTFSLKYTKPNDLIGYPNYVELNAVIGSVSATDKIQDDINKGFGELKVEFQESTDKIIESNNKTQEAIKEQTETSKNIFQKIGDILNILNPFSENFFAYKLVELFLNMLKSLFIPSDDFFNNWLADLNEYFGDRFRCHLLSF